MAPFSLLCSCAPLHTPHQMSFGVGEGGSTERGCTLVVGWGHTPALCTHNAHTTSPPRFPPPASYLHGRTPPTRSKRDLRCTPASPPIPSARRQLRLLLNNPSDIACPYASGLEKQRTHHRTVDLISLLTAASMCRC